jgi:hypothetical protein
MDYLIPKHCGNLNQVLGWEQVSVFRAQQSVLV